ncbi:MAG: OmpA family protein [Tannerella sp.]|jgi:outer membrane protein OmpA-like peptidoglycan-associated protein|nr:OmpA family protein [Tannerella sp.]
MIQKIKNSFFVRSFGLTCLTLFFLLPAGCKTRRIRGVDSTIAGMMETQQIELQSVSPSGVIFVPIDNREALKIIFDSGTLFASNSNTITEDAKKNLRQYAAIFNRYPASSIQITGYTDNTGRADYNQTLSERRANSIYDFWVEQGVDPSRMSYSGKGIREPIANNYTAKGRALNRRVEILIINHHSF